MKKLLLVAVLLLGNAALAQSTDPAVAEAQRHAEQVAKDAAAAQKAADEALAAARKHAVEVAKQQAAQQEANAKAIQDPDFIAWKIQRDLDEYRAWKAQHDRDVYAKCVASFESPRERALHTLERCGPEPK